LGIDQNQRGFQTKLLAYMRDQAVRNKLEILNEAASQPNRAEQQREPDLIALAATLRDLAPIRFGESEVAEQLRARDVRRNSLKANARVPNGWLRNRELNNLPLFHPLTIAALRIMFSQKPV